MSFNKHQKKLSGDQRRSRWLCYRSTTSVSEGILHAKNDLRWLYGNVSWNQAFNLV